MKNYTPDDLKKQWPGKYDDWKFGVNGKGEWVGLNGTVEGKIVTIKDKNGKDIPTIGLHNTVATAGFGGNIIKQGLVSLFGSSKK